MSATTIATSGESLHGPPSGPLAIAAAGLARHAAPLADPGAGLCVFTIDDGRFGIDVACIGEVVQVAKLVPVPLAPPALIGLHNLRGVPLEVLDPGLLLDLPHAADRARPASDTVLVFQGRGMQVGILVERVEAVLSLERVRQSPRSGDEPALVRGVADIDLHGGCTATLLDAEALAERLEGLRMDRVGGPPP
jgi:chemotaxis signal transduction protein